MKVFFSRCLAVAAIIGGTTAMAAVTYPEGMFPKRSGAGQKTMIPPDYDPNAPHLWLVEVVGGDLRIINDYEDAGDCWNATFWKDGTRPAETKTGAWRACLPLDEPAELALSKHIMLEMGEITE